MKLQNIFLNATQIPWSLFCCLVKPYQRLSKNISLVFSNSSQIIIFNNESNLAYCILILKQNVELKQTLQHEICPPCFVDSTKVCWELKYPGNHFDLHEVVGWLLNIRSNVIKYNDQVTGGGNMEMIVGRSVQMTLLPVEMGLTQSVSQAGQLSKALIVYVNDTGKTSMCRKMLYIGWFTGRGRTKSERAQGRVEGAT